MADGTDEVVVDAPGLEEVPVVPWPLLLRRRVQQRVGDRDGYRWIVLGAALFGLFTVGFSITVLSIAIGDIAAEFGVSTNAMIWIITGPILLGAIVTPAAGKLADIFGARRVYLLSMLVVAVFAGLAAMAWSAGSLIAFRVIGAAIGAATGPASIAIINRLFPKEQRAQAFGYWALVGAGGPVIGVVVGGPIVEYISWRWVFAAQVPLSLATFVVCAAIFPDTPRRDNLRFDYIGAGLLAVGTGSFVLALNRVPEAGWGWTNPLVIAGLVISPIALVAFYSFERRIDHQLVPIRYLTRRNVVMPLSNLFFMNFAYMGGFFLTPLFLQEVLSYSESKTGFISIARPLTFAVVGPIAGWFATRVGERVNAVAGGAVIALSMAIFASSGAHTTELVIILALMLSGAGNGATSPAMASAIANSVDPEDLGVVGGAQQMVAELGVVVGTQAMITVQQTASTTDANGYSLAYFVGAIAALVSVAAAAFVHPTIGRKLGGTAGGSPQGVAEANR